MSSGCTPVTPYDTSAAAASLLTPVQPSPYRCTTVRAGGRAFPSEGGMVLLLTRASHHVRGRRGDGEGQRQEGKLLTAWSRAGGLEGGGPHRTPLSSV